MHLFHYHLVTSKVRDVEARYIAKLGFQLVARYGRIGDEQTHFEAGVPWEELDRLGFRLRLSELERGAVNVVVQPGQWDLPRIDHVGFALDEDEFIDDIPFPETQNYVKRILGTAEDYRRLYPDGSTIPHTISTLSPAKAPAKASAARKSTTKKKTQPKKTTPTRKKAPVKKTP